MRQRDLRFTFSVLSAQMEAFNEGKDASVCAHVFTARSLGNGTALIARGETPYEARLRLQGEAYSEAQSFHSAIPHNPEHSRQVLAYDIAVGAGECVDDASFYAYLCRIADWRLGWDNTVKGVYAEGAAELDLPDEAVEQIYASEEKDNLDLIHFTLNNRRTGSFPRLVTDMMPSLVASQAWGGRKAGKSIRFGGGI